MYRSRLTYLQTWLTLPKRKPLVIRGARQVGKTWLVRSFAKASQKQLIELNLEKQPQLASLFIDNNPRQTLLNLSALYNQSIEPENYLLFIDEIQVAPELLSKLRWFFEELPELPIIAAGSLLDFALAKHSFSMPVGRISYMYLEPLSFEEFLLANDKTVLSDYLIKYQLDNELPLAIHEELTRFFKEYLIIGGLPAAVSSWIKAHSLHDVNRIHHDLLATYRDDFAKYSGHIAVEKIDAVMMATPKMLGQKFVYSHISPSLNINNAKQIIDLLAKARICHPVLSCAANGVPLGAEVKEKFFKEIFLDVGLSSALSGLTFNQVNITDEIMLINKGALAEQVAGQILRTIQLPYINPALYYWQREEKGSNAEIDYVIEHKNYVIPLEVKAGSTGGLKSLHLFMGLKNFPVAARVNASFPNKTAIRVKTHSGKGVKYTLLSLPFYLLGQLHRLLDGIL
jgi:uncharacterized protein